MDLSTKITRIDVAFSARLITADELTALKFQACTDFIAEAMPAATRIAHGMEYENLRKSLLYLDSISLTE